MRITRRAAAVFLLFGLALWPAVVAALAPVAQAQGSAQVFTLRGVEVDVTADTVTAAREQALAQGQVRALRALLERLVLPEDQGAIPSLSASEVQDYVLDFGVSDERTSAVRYIATMTVRFRPGAVRRLLRANGLRFAEVQSKPVLVLPVWSRGGAARLWEGSNPWLRAWIAESDVAELVPVLTPLGDLEDLRDIDAQQAVAGDSTRLRTIGERYGADSVLVSHATLEGDPEVGLARVRVESRRYREGQPGETIVDSFGQQQGEDLQALLERATATIDQGLQEEWKRANVMSFESLERLLVEVPVDALSDWLTVRRRLEGLASVAAADLTSLTRARAVIELGFYGTLDQLLGQLEQRDLVLTRIGPGGFGPGGFGPGGSDPGRGGDAGRQTVVVDGRGVQSGGPPAAGQMQGQGRQPVAAERQPAWRLTTRARAEAESGQRGGVAPAAMPQAGGATDGRPAGAAGGAVGGGTPAQ